MKKSNDIQLTDLEWHLADILLNSVVNKEGRLSYTEVAEKLSNRLNREINPHLGLRNALGRVSTLCFNLGLPLISATVIYANAKSNQMVGEGFAPFASSFRPEYKSMTAADVWKSELKLIQNCLDWDRLRKHLDNEPMETDIVKENVISDVGKNVETLPSPQHQFSEPVFPDEIDLTSSKIKEGALKTVTVSIHERNAAARRRCIEYYGTVCAVCDKDLGDIYGKEFSGKIHVHHLNPISDYDTEHDIDPINDLRPVCPNCHMIIHCRQDRPYSIEEARLLLRRS